MEIKAFYIGKLRNLSAKNIPKRYWLRSWWAGKGSNSHLRSAVPSFARQSVSLPMTARADREHTTWSPMVRPLLCVAAALNWEF